MSTWKQISTGETTIDFVGLRRRWFMLSGALLLISVVALGVRGLNLGLEFVGGVSVETQNDTGAAIEAYRSALDGVGITDARIQLVNGGAAVLVQTGPLDQDVENRVVDAIAQVAGVDRSVISLTAVGPTFGSLVARQALIALAVFLAIAVLFISWRLQWKMALVGIAALAHDVMITVGIYALLQFPVTPATVVALLTILGYSLYDTVVVFDRVDEYTDELTDVTYTEIVNRSMNKVLIRSLLTSLTSLLPIGSLLFIGSLILGAASLQDFALALFVGIAAGTYSSVFIAGPLLAVWRESEPRWIERREIIERGHVRRSRRRGAEQTEDEPAPVETETAPRPPKSGQPPKGQGKGPAPRAPKKRGR